MRSRAVLARSWVIQMLDNKGNKVCLASKLELPIIVNRLLLERRLEQPSRRVPMDKRMRPDNTQLQEPLSNNIKIIHKWHMAIRITKECQEDKHTLDNNNTHRTHISNTRQPSLRRDSILTLLNKWVIQADKYLQHALLDTKDLILVRLRSLCRTDLLGRSYYHRKQCRENFSSTEFKTLLKRYFTTTLSDLVK